MSQVGFTPISIYFSATASSVPTAANLVAGELAINTNDGKLFYKDSSGVVQTIASKAGALGDVVGPASATDNALARFDLTTGKLIQNSVVTISDTGAISAPVDASISGLTVGKGGGANANNTVLGNNGALSTNSTGTGLTAVGGFTLKMNTADYNSAFGWASLQANTSGTQNAAFGTSDATFNATLGSNTTGSYNNAFGNGALARNTTGQYNTAVGSFALSANTTAFYNTGIGHQAGYSNTTGSITAVGTQVLFANTTGVNNVAVGGTDNIGAIPALRYNTTGSYNTAIGGAALGNNTTASNNTAVGYQAGYSNTGAGPVDAFGSAALYTNTTGTGNSAFARQALQYNTTGSQNVAMGVAALNSNTTGSSNVAIGYYSLLLNTTASNNTAVGYQSGYSNTTGTNNCAVGRFALRNCTTGTENTVLGTDAGDAITTGTDNTLVGYGAGYLMTTGSKNSVLGAYSGNQGGLDIRTASNYIVLSDGDGNPRGVFNPSGFLKVAGTGSIIGTASAYHELNSSSGDTMFRLTQSSATPFGMVIDYTGAAPNANSNAYLTCQDNSGGGRVTVRIWANGNMQNLNNSYGSLSDQSIKENIVNATPKLADLMQVKIRNFNLIGDKTKQIGVVAQELETVFPSMVELTEDGIKGVKYSVFVPMLIKAIQELKAEVDSLKQQLGK